MWIIHRIHDDRIDLTSPADAGEHRWITHDYAASHVHLAYASTVHGVQGDTTHTAVVGPDVNGVGLYVGLTRGRHLNTAVVISRTDTAAIDVLAASMTRSDTEASIEQAAAAVGAELRPAARARAGARPRARVDPTVPNALGHVPHALVR